MAQINWSSSTNLPDSPDSPRVGRYADGRLEIFMSGSDGALWHTWQTAPNSSQWGDWAPFPKPSATVNVSGPVVGQYADGRLEIFMSGSDGALWHIWQTAPNSSQWGGWAPFPKPSATVNVSGPVVGRHADGRLEIFMSGSDGALWHIWQTAPNSSQWGGWESLGTPPGTVNVSGPVVGRYADGRLEIFMSGSDGALWHTWQTAPNSSQWGDWAPFPKPSATVNVSGPIVGRYADGRLEIFMSGSDGALWHIWQTAPNSSQWGGWESLGTPPDISVGSLAVSQNADGRLEVFMSGSDGALWHITQVLPPTPSPSPLRWGAWESLGTPPNTNLSSSLPVVAHNADGRLEVFIKVGRVLWHAGQVVTGAWGPKSSSEYVIEMMGFKGLIAFDGDSTAAAWNPTAAALNLLAPQFGRVVAVGNAGSVSVQSGKTILDLTLQFTDGRTTNAQQLALTFTSDASSFSGAYQEGDSSDSRLPVLGWRTRGPADQSMPAAYQMPAYEPPGRKDLTVVHVMHAEDDQARPLSWWGAMPKKDTPNYQLLEVAQSVSRKTLALYKLPNDYSSADPADLERYKIYEINYGERYAPCGVDQDACLLAAYRMIFFEAIQRFPSARFGMKYSGHGSPYGIFQALSYDQVPLFYSSVSTNLGRKIDFLDWSTNCNTASYRLMFYQAPCASYVVSSDLERTDAGAQASFQQWQSMHPDNRYGAYWDPSKSILDSLNEMLNDLNSLWHTPEATAYYQNTANVGREQSLSIFDLQMFDGLVTAGNLQAVENSQGTYFSDSDYFTDGILKEADVSQYLKRTNPPDTAGRKAALAALGACQVRYISNKDIFTWRDNLGDNANGLFFWKGL